MSESFAGAALRWQALAARWLGWRPEEFWAATPVELAHSLAEPNADAAPPTRSEIDRMMEQDRHGR